MRRKMSLFIALAIFFSVGFLVQVNSAEQADVDVKVYIKKSLYSYVEAEVQKIKEQRNLELGAGGYESEHHMCWQLEDGIYYPQGMSYINGKNYVKTVWFYEDIQGDPRDILNYPSSSEFPILPPPNGLVFSYQHITLEDALNFALKENDLPGNSQTYLTYLRQRYPLFPQDDANFEELPDSYTVITGTDALKNIDLVVDTEIPDSYVIYMFSDKGDQPMIPASFTESQIYSLVKLRGKELYEFLDTFKRETSLLREQAKLAVIIPIYKTIWSQIEALGGTMMEGGVDSDGYPWGLQGGSFWCTTPSSAIDAIAAIPGIEKFEEDRPMTYASDSNQASALSDDKVFYDKYDLLQFGSGLFSDHIFSPISPAWFLQPLQLWPQNSIYDQSLMQNSYIISSPFTYSLPSPPQNYLSIPATMPTLTTWSEHNSQGWEYQPPVWVEVSDPGNFNQWYGSEIWSYNQPINNFLPMSKQFNYTSYNSFSPIWNNFRFWLNF